MHIRPEDRIESGTKVRVFWHNQELPLEGVVRSAPNELNGVWIILSTNNEIWYVQGWQSIRKL